MTEFSARDKYSCAIREVRQRERVYPRLVSVGHMKPAFAALQIRLMAEIAADYWALAEVEEQKERLL